MYETCQIRAHIPLRFLIRNIASNRPFIPVTIAKQLNSKIGETYCEGFKWMCKISETNG